VVYNRRAPAETWNFGKLEAMKRVLVLAALIFLNFICVAETPHGCASAAASKSNEDEVFLQDSGSTNAASFCYAVTRSGKVAKRTGATIFQKRQGAPVPPDEQGSIPASLAEKLFGDVEAAMPLSALPAARCAKSVSFGSYRYVWFKGEKSPDLCGRGSEKVAALQQDFARVMSSAVFEHVSKE